MADSLYLLTLKMTEKVVKVMNEKEKKMVDTASFCFCLLWSLVFKIISCTKIHHFKSAFHTRDQYPNLGQALLPSMKLHS